METILAILLYLQVIQSPGTYTSSQIDADVKANQAQVDEIESNQEELNSIINQYGEDVNGITVINDDQMK